MNAEPPQKKHINTDTPAHLYNVNFLSTRCQLRLQQRPGFSAHAINVIKNGYSTNLVETPVQDRLADGVRSGEEERSQRLASTSTDDIIQCEMCAGMTEWYLRDVKIGSANTNKVDRQRKSRS